MSVVAKVHRSFDIEEYTVVTETIAKAEKPSPYDLEAVHEGLKKL